MSKQARTDHPIHDPIAARWSPYGYAPRDVPADDLRSLLEAARWSASAFNEQPWRYIVAENHARNGKPNASALHDLGQASANLSVEAAVRGLSVHQMAGILPDRARDLFGIPQGYRAVTGLAIGYAADPSDLPEDLRKRDTAPRERKSLADIVFTGAWGRASPLLGD